MDIQTMLQNVIESATEGNNNQDETACYLKWVNHQKTEIEENFRASLIKFVFNKDLPADQIAKLKESLKFLSDSINKEISVFAAQVEQITRKIEKH